MGFFEALDTSIAPLITNLNHKVQRHAAITANIANVDTPGYKAIDVTFREALMGAGISMTRTNPGHMLAGGAKSGGALDVVELGGVPRRDGNDVNIDHEMVKLAENQLEFRYAAKMLGRKFNKIREAITGRTA